MPWPLFTNLAELARVRAADKGFAPVPEVGTLVDDDLDRLATTALGCAAACIGRGEEGANNAGPFVASLLEPTKPPQNWCAALVGAMYASSATLLGYRLPFRRSLGAKRLGENVAAVGRKFTDHREAKPGDLLVLHRGAQGSWLGHVALVDQVLGDRVYVIEGNAGPFPAKVRRSFYDVGKARIAFLASVRKG